MADDHGSLEPTPRDPPIAPPQLTPVQLDFIAERVTRHFATLTDGKWQPGKDVPAAVLIVVYLSAALALMGFGAHELLAVLSAIQS